MVGRKLKSGTILFRKLSDFKLIKLMNICSQKEIAKKFNVHSSFISLELTKRNLFVPTVKRKVSRISEEKYEYTQTEAECLEFCSNSWMNSKERIAIMQYKLINKEDFN